MGARNPFRCKKCSKSIPQRMKKKHMEMHYDESLKRLREGRIQPSYTRRGLATNIPAVACKAYVHQHVPEDYMHIWLHTHKHVDTQRVPRQVTFTFALATRHVVCLHVDRRLCTGNAQLNMLQTLYCQDPLNAYTSRSSLHIQLTTDYSYRSTRLINTNSTPAATNTSDVNPSLPGFQGANDMTDDDMDITLAVLEDAYDITDDMDMGITLAGLEDANDMEFVEGEVVGIKYGFLQLLYMDGGSNYALIETVHPIKRDKTSGCAYYDRAEHRKRLNRVRLSDTISLAIEVPSIYKEHPTRINISWKH